MSDGKALDVHLFVCTNKKEKGECCADKGAAQLRDRVKKLAKDPARALPGKIRVNAAGCLGHCEAGITAVVYPRGRWLTGLKSTDDELLLSAIKEALEPKNG